MKNMYSQHMLMLIWNPFQVSNVYGKKIYFDSEFLLCLTPHSNIIFRLCRRGGAVVINIWHLHNKIDQWWRLLNVTPVRKRTGGRPCPGVAGGLSSLGALALAGGLAQSQRSLVSDPTASFTQSRLRLTRRPLTPWVSFGGLFISAARPQSILSPPALRSQASRFWRVT